MNATPAWKSITGKVWAVLAGVLAIAAFTDAVIVGGILFALSAFAAVPASRGLLSRYGIFGGRRIALVAAAAVAGLVAVGVAAPQAPVNPQGLAEQAAASKADSDTAAAREKVKADETHAVAKRAFVGQYRQLLVLAKPCDQAVTALAKAANSGDQYSTYEAAKHGDRVCRKTATTIGGMSASASTYGEDAKKIEKAISTCRSAYIFKQMGMAKAMAIADGDGRPSVVSDMSEDLKTGQAGALLCVAEFFAAGSKLGIDLKELS